MPIGVLASAFVLSFTSVGAHAEITQTLDSVDAYGTTAAIKMRFDDTRADRVSQQSDFLRTPVLATAAGRSFVACARAPNRDLICIENDRLVLWEDAEEVIPGTSTTPARPLFPCTDRALGLVTSGLPCTAIAADTNGHLWLAGRTRGKTTHSVLKVIAVPNVTPTSPTQVLTCPALPASFRPLEWNRTNPSTDPFDYCVAEYANGRPVLEDMVYVGGDSADRFVGPDGVRGPGVLMMEQKLTVSFIPDPASPPVLPLVPKIIGETRSQWKLEGSGQRAEVLQGVAVLQRDVNATTIANYVVATTSWGRVLAKKADGLSDAFLVFNELTPSNCTAPVKYSVRTRYESNRVYVADRACRRVVALETTTSVPTNDTTCSNLGGEFFLCNARESDASGNFVDVTLSTADQDPLTVDADPIGLIVSPGVGIDMNECTSDSRGFCIWEQDGNGNQIGARMSQVTLADRNKSGLTVYRILDIPDCRQWPHRPGAPNGNPATQQICTDANAIVTIGTEEFLNVSPLLPTVIQRLFNSTTIPTALPQMLISPIYRAQERLPLMIQDPNDPTKTIANPANRTFEAFFGRTEEGVVFRGNFQLEFDVPELTETNFGCGDSQVGEPDFEWNVPLTISERVTTASVLAKSGMPGELRRNVDMLTILSCENPDRVFGSRTSLWPYNMEIVPEELPSNPYGVGLNQNDAYADLLYLLYQELGLSLTEFAGKFSTADGETIAAFSASTVNSLKGTFDNGQDKLKKCIEAAYDKQSAADQACQAFDSQLKNFRSSVLAAPRQGNDPANRIGEVVGRTDVISYVLYKLFLPSVPTDGFN